MHRLVKDSLDGGAAVAVVQCTANQIITGTTAIAVMQEPTNPRGPNGCGRVDYPLSF